MFSPTQLNNRMWRRQSRWNNVFPEFCFTSESSWRKSYKQSIIVSRYFCSRRSLHLWRLVNTETIFEPGSKNRSWMSFSYKKRYLILLVQVATLTTDYLAALTQLLGCLRDLVDRIGGTSKKWGDQCSTTFPHRQRCLE